MIQFGGQSRRSFISMVGGASLAGMLRTPLAFAKGIDDRYLILVILRGALDGLGAVIPYQELQLRDWRKILVPPEPGRDGGALSLDAGGFAFNPAMNFMHSSYRAGDLSVLHAASSPYRERSHFDGQDVLENGAGGVLQARDGWLNRALQKTSGDIEAAAVGGALPLVLRGDAHAVSWAPSFLPEPGEDTLERLMRMYEGDEALRTALLDAQELDMAAGEMKGDARQVIRGRDYEPLMEAGANLISSGAAGVVVLSLSGWDTHNSQGAESGTLANRLRQLDDGLLSMKKTLGPKWNNSAIIVASEFGRTVKVNGSRGSDHGTGGVSFLLGGAVNGGRVLGDWPGLAGSALYEGRDLYPANDLRGLFKGVLRDHLGVAGTDLERSVFPGSKEAPPLEGLITVNA